MLLIRFSRPTIRYCVLFSFYLSIYSNWRWLHCTPSTHQWIFESSAMGLFELPDPSHTRWKRCWSEEWPEDDQEVALQRKLCSQLVTNDWAEKQHTGKFISFLKHAFFPSFHLLYEKKKREREKEKHGVDHAFPLLIIQAQRINQEEIRPWPMKQWWNLKGERAERTNEHTCVAMQ